MEAAKEALLKSIKDPENRSGNFAKKGTAPAEINEKARAYNVQIDRLAALTGQARPPQDDILQQATKLVEEWKELEEKLEEKLKAFNKARKASPPDDIDGYKSAKKTLKKAYEATEEFAGQLQTERKAAEEKYDEWEKKQWKKEQIEVSKLNRRK